MCSVYCVLILRQKRKKDIELLPKCYPIQMLPEDFDKPSCSTELYHIDCLSGLPVGQVRPKRRPKEVGM